MGRIPRLPSLRPGDSMYVPIDTPVRLMTAPSCRAERMPSGKHLSLAFKGIVDARLRGTPGADWGLQRLCVWVGKWPTSPLGHGGQAKNRHATTPNTPPNGNSATASSCPSPRGSQGPHQRTLSSPQSKPENCGRHTPGKAKLGPLRRVLSGIQWNLGQGSPPRGLRQWTAIRLAPQSRMSPVQTAKRTGTQRWVLGGHPGVSYRTQRANITKRPGENRTRVGESVSPKRAPMHNPRGMPQPLAETGEETQD